MNRKQQNKNRLDSRSTVVLGSGRVKPYFTTSSRPRHCQFSLRPEVRFGWTLDFATMVSSQNFTAAYIKVFLLFNVFAMSCVSVLALSSLMCFAAM